MKGSWPTPAVDAAEALAAKYAADWPGWGHRKIAAMMRADGHEASTPTGRGVDALACLDAAVDEAERVLGLDDLRDDRGELELVDENTGEVIDVVLARIAVVSDNGSCFRGETYQSAFAGDEPLLRHVRTRVEPADRRRHRAILRHVDVRAPLPRADRRRRRASDGDRPLPRHLQPHPAFFGVRWSVA